MNTKNKVLVAHASKYNSTAEIAEAIGDTMRQHDGLDVEVLPVGRVESLDPYSAVILGSALYVGAVDASAVAFLNDSCEALARLPVWLFASGPAGTGEPETLMKSWFLYPPTLRAVIARVIPREVKLFHGKLDPDKVNPVERIVVKRVNAAYGDFRQWDVIADWAENIAQALETEAAL